MPPYSAGPGPAGCTPTPANSTNNTYCLNTNMTGVDAGEQYCNDLGGHLVSWNSQAEQTEVEGYWVNAGLLLPTFHKLYWMGAFLSDEDIWPSFRWRVGGNLMWFSYSTLMRHCASQHLDCFGSLENTCLCLS